MIHAFGIARIEHADTGEAYTIDKDLLNFERTDSISHDGDVMVGSFAIIQHPQLGRLTWTVWEYPIRFQNDDETNVGPHKIIRNFAFQFELDDDLAKHDKDKRRINFLVGWFNENFEDPAESVTYVSREGGYQWQNGGPCEAREELENKFPNEPVEIIEAAVEEIELEGIYEWSPIQDVRDSDTEYMFPDRDLEDINDELSTLIDNAPKSKTAPAFALGDDNRFHITLPPDRQPFDNQNNSPKGLRTTIDKLLELLKKGNVHQDLIPIIEDYKEVILGDEISISDLHWNGVILGNMAQAIKDGIDKKEEPPLSLKTETYLNSVLDLHYTYMMLDEKGQRLMNAGDYRKSAEQIEGLKDAIGQLSNIITESPDLLDEGIRRYVSNVLKGIGQGNHPERSNQSIGNILTNLVSDILGWIKRNSTQTITDLVINKVIEGALGLDSIAIGTVAINGALLLVKIAPLLLIVVAPFAGELSWLASTAHLLERIRLMIKSD